MGWLSKFFEGKERGPHKSKAGLPEHALLLHLKLSNDELGTGEEVGEMHALQDQLEQALVDAGAGELDGDEFGGGFCVIYLYGANANTMWDAVVPVLRRQTFRAGSFVLQRYGPPREGIEKRIDLPVSGRTSQSLVARGEWAQHTAPRG